MEQVDKWTPPEAGGAPLLTMPNVPKPMHLCPPREIMGRPAWDKMRKSCYAEHNNICEICGRVCGQHRGEPYMRNAHEVYEIDYTTKTMTFIRPCCIDSQCVDEETEVLTSQGWVRINKVTTEHEVACWDVDGTIDFLRPSSTVTTHPEEAIEIKGHGSTLYFSPNHRLPLRVASKQSPTYGRVVDILAAEYKPSHYYNWITGGLTKCDKTFLSYDERVYIAIEADGHLTHDKEHPHGKGQRVRPYYESTRSKELRYTYSVRLKKKRKIERLLWLLRNSTLPYRVSDKNDGYTAFTIWTAVECKNFVNCFDVEMGSRKAAEFLDELVLWDETREHTPIWHTAKKREVDFVQAVAAQCGRFTHVGVVDRIGKLRKGQYKTPYDKVYYAVTIRTKHTELCARELKPTRIKWDKPMYCLTVPTTYFIARRDGLVFATGNCHNFIHSGRAIAMYQNHTPLWTKEMMLELAEHGFRLIAEWNKSHPNDEPLRAFSAFTDWLAEPTLATELQALIDQYEIQFYTVPPTDTPDDWGKWKLVYDGEEHYSPYQTAEEWEAAIEAQNNRTKVASKQLFEGEVFEELRRNIREKAKSKPPRQKPKPSACNRRRSAN